MERIDNILHHPKFMEAISKTTEMEKDRIYCLHGLEHAVDTARISYILTLEENLSIDKDIIYAAALLHDTGRFSQYMSGTPHQQISIELAKEILPQCGYNSAEISEILIAINSHRHGETKNLLGKILQQADNLSRLCFNCKARSTCKWDKNEMNMSLEY